jgi:hypothetical protein
LDLVKPLLSRVAEKLVYRQTRAKIVEAEGASLNVPKGITFMSKLSKNICMQIMHKI